MAGITAITGRSSRSAIRTDEWRARNRPEAGPTPSARRVIYTAVDSAGWVALSDD
ncbi:MAG TPA: hypothetical protein VKU44_06725 [Terriglobia bacterium]|nr:hypothetical protein [Terriglobia bacterium]